MNLVKTSFYTSISTAITFISGFIVTKVVAVQIGPAGMAIVGQFQNVAAILLMFATGAVANGVVKYLSQYSNDKEKQKAVIITVFKMAIICSLVVGLLTVLFSTYLSVKIFKTEEYAIVFRLYAAFLVILAFNAIFTAIFNGLKEIKRLTISNISASVIAIVFTTGMAYKFGVVGVLTAANFAAVIILGINIYLFTGGKLAVIKEYVRGFNTAIIKLLFSFTVISIVTILLVPVVQILVRDKIITEYGAAIAGCWQGVTRISDYYLAFVTTVLSVYYLPRLSELVDPKAILNEITSGYKKILPVVILMALLIWIFRSLIIDIVFTKEFVPMKPLFLFQLVGDVFKIGSWLIAFLMLAKAKIRLYIITEITFNITYVISSFILINKFGVIGATYSFCINYFIYWMLMLFILKKGILKLNPVN